VRDLKFDTTYWTVSVSGEKKGEISKPEDGLYVTYDENDNEIGRFKTYGAAYSHVAGRLHPYESGQFRVSPYEWSLLEKREAERRGHVRKISETLYEVELKTCTGTIRASCSGFEEAQAFACCYEDSVPAPAPPYEAEVGSVAIRLVKDGVYRLDNLLTGEWLGYFPTAKAASEYVKYLDRAAESEKSASAELEKSAAEAPAEVDGTVDWPGCPWCRCSGDLRRVWFKYTGRVAVLREGARDDDIVISWLVNVYPTTGARNCSHCGGARPERITDCVGLLRDLKSAEQLFESVIELEGRYNLEYREKCERFTQQ